MHFYNNFRKKCLRHGRFDMNDALPPVVLCGIVVAILHVSHGQAIGSPWVSMDIPMDIHEKICGYGWEISYPRQAWLFFSGTR